MNLHVPVLCASSPAPALHAASQVAAPAERTPTPPNSPFRPECAAALSGCCTDPKCPGGADPASGLPAELAPIAALAGARLVQDAPSPHQRWPQVDGLAEK